MRIGVNLYGLQEQLNNSIPDTFRFLRKNGIDEVELVAVPDQKQGKWSAAIVTEESIGQMIQYATECGLDIRSAHILCAFGWRLRPVSSVARIVGILNQEYGIGCFVFSGMFSSAWGARRFAWYMNRLSDMVSDLDCTLLYHNHNQEFAEVIVRGEKMTALDHFFRLTHGNIRLQLDIGWAGIGGDEIAVAKKYAERIVSLHLKDFTVGTKADYKTIHMPKERFCAVGTGEIQIAAVLALRNTFPNFMDSIIIDQDHSICGMLGDIANGFRLVQLMDQPWEV